LFDLPSFDFVFVLTLLKLLPFKLAKTEKKEEKFARRKILILTSLSLNVKKNAIVFELFD
jgi:hypothetical protein